MPDSERYRRKKKVVSTFPEGDLTSFSPQALLKAHNLPIAAYLQAPTAPRDLDLNSPLLLFSHYSSRKVRAVSLRAGEDGIEVAGPPLVIPDSYTGWFSIVTKEGSRARTYRSIEEVAKAKVPFFLTRFDLKGYVKKIRSLNDSSHSYEKMTIPGGHVLKLLGIFQDLNASSRRFSRMISPPTSANKYAQCLNHRKEVIYVPLAAAGKFYATASKGKKDVETVHLISQILKRFSLPVTVRLVCGYLQHIPSSFTGVLRLEEAKSERVILGCTMTTEAKATLMEMDIMSNLLLRPIRDAGFSKSPIFLKTLSFCEDEGDTWRRQIKIIHHVLDSRKNSPSNNLGFPFDLDLKFGRSRVKLINRDSKKNVSICNDIFQFCRPGDELKEKNCRKIKKQNTYVFQKDMAIKGEPTPCPKALMENQDYSLVVDDISSQHLVEEESCYAEICDPSDDVCMTSLGSSLESTRSQSNISDKWGFANRDSLYSAGTENGQTFTLLKKDVSKYYIDLPGFDSSLQSISSTSVC